MTEFTVYFDIYGKKLKTKITAKDEIDAMEIVKTSIQVVKVRKEPEFKKKTEKSDPLDDFDNIFQDFLDLFGKKK